MFNEQIQVHKRRVDDDGSWYFMMMILHPYREVGSSYLLQIKTFWRTVVWIKKAEERDEVWATHSCSRKIYLHDRRAKKSKKILQGKKHTYHPEDETSDYSKAIIQSECIISLIVLFMSWCSSQFLYRNPVSFSTFFLLPPLLQPVIFFISWHDTHQTTWNSLAPSTLLSSQMMMQSHIKVNLLLKMNEREKMILSGTRFSL